MGIGQIILIALGAYAALKFYRQQKEIEVELSNRGVNRPGVSFYPPIVVTQRPAQAQAYNENNACATMGGAYAPPIGPSENVPPPCQEWIS